MPPEARDRALILDMIDQAEAVATFVAGRTREDLVWTVATADIPAVLPALRSLAGIDSGA